MKLLPDFEKLPECSGIFYWFIVSLLGWVILLVWGITLYLGFSIGE